jgi:hypothetical protein
MKIGRVFRIGPKCGVTASRSDRVGCPMNSEQVDATVDRILATLAGQLASGVLSPADYADQLAILKHYAKIWYCGGWQENPRHRN